MDAKEAIVELTKMYVFNCLIDDNESETVEVQRKIKSLQIAISALEKVEALEAENARLREKEVPQKPKEKPQGGIIKCPVCGEFINWYARFCWNCGQAIKIDKE